MLKKINDDAALALILVILGYDPNDVLQWNKQRQELDYTYQFKPGGPMPPIIRDNRSGNPYGYFGRMQGL